MAKEKIEEQETTTTEMAEYEGSFEQVIPMDSAFSAEGENAVFCSMVIAPENKQDLFKLHTIKNNPKHRLNDCIGSVIRCTGFVAHWVPTKIRQPASLAVLLELSLSMTRGSLMLPCPLVCLMPLDRFVWTCGHLTQTPPFPFLSKRKKESTASSTRR